MSATSVSIVKGHPGVPSWMPDEGQHRRFMAAAINRHNQAKFNCTVDVTLNPNTGATQIYDNRISFFCAIAPFMPMSLDAAADMAAGLWFDGLMPAFAATSGSVTVHHRVASPTDRIIRFVIVG